MKNYFKVITILSLFIIFSCSKDEVPNAAPEIKAQSFNVSEDIESSSVIGKVVATDVEKGELIYSITIKPELFEISNSGDIKLVAGASLDFETATSHIITVQVSDGELTASAKITINVVDVDENVAPVISAQTFSIAENATASTEIANIVASDANGNTLTYSISQNVFQNGVTSQPIFKLLQSNSGELRLGDKRSLNFETETSYTITIEVSDGVLSASADITINVTNVNEAPVITDSSTINDVAEDIADTVIIGSMVATDPENDTLNWSLSTNPNNLFEINNNGEISLASGKNLDYETATSHKITVTVTDTGSLSETANYTINVTDVAEGASVNIPDAKFKAALVVNTAINTNKDNEIQVTEAVAFSGTIDVRNKGISDLTGVEAFVNLTKLNCNNNNLTSFDISKNTNLTVLKCDGNGLTSLDISNNTLLTELRVYQNSLTSIDVSKNTALSTFSISENNLTSLDVSNNAALSILYCAVNSLTSLDVSNNTVLTRLRCFENNLTSLNISNGNNSKLWDFMANANAGLTCIKIDTGFTPPNSGWIKDAAASYNTTCQ